MVSGLEIDDNNERVVCLLTEKSTFRPNKGGLLNSSEHVLKATYLPFYAKVSDLEVYDIERDISVVAIEKSFGMPIEDLVGMINSDRAFGSTLSPITLRYVKPEVLEVLKRFGTTNTELLKVLGFDVTKVDGQYTAIHDQLSFKLTYDDNLDGYANVILQDGTTYFKNLEVISDALEIDGYCLGVNEGDEATVLRLASLMLTFVNKRVYEAMSKELSADRNVRLSIGYPETMIEEVVGFNNFVNGLYASNRVVAVTKTFYEDHYEERIEIRRGLEDVIRLEIARLESA